MALGALSKALGAPIRKVIFTGGRDIGGLGASGYKSVFGQNRKTIFEVLDNLGLDPLETTVIHGGARGADSVVGDWAKARGFQVKVYPANWEKHKKAAGGKRNWQMLLAEEPDLVISLPGGSGTRHMVDISQRKNVPVFSIDDAIAEAIRREGPQAVAVRLAQAFAAKLKHSGQTMRMPMVYRDGTQGMRMRPEYAGASTLELIKKGVRTSTTRNLSNEDLARLTPGSRVTFYSGKDSVDVVITEAPRRIPRPANAQQLEEMAQAWSQVEGWAPEHFAKYIGNYQIRYRLADSVQPSLLPGESVGWSRVASVSKDPKVWEASSKAPKSQSIFRGFDDNLPSKRKMTEDGAPLSAFRMRFKDGRTIEEVYQTDVKGYSSVVAGKGKPTLRGQSQDELYEQYKGLWRRWFDENPDQLDLAKSVLSGKRINDFWAAPTAKRPQGVANNQARAIFEILNETAPSPSVVSGVAAQPDVVVPATALLRGYQDQIRRATEALASGSTSPKFYNSQYKTINKWAMENSGELSVQQLDELRLLSREVGLRGRDEYWALKGFTDDIDDLMRQGLSNEDAAPLFVDIQNEFLTYVETMGLTESTALGLGQVYTNTLARFSGVGRQLGVRGRAGGRVGDNKLGNIADEILGENIPPVAGPLGPVVLKGGKVATELDELAAMRFSKEQVDDALKGIGIGRREGPDGAVKWDVSPEDILRVDKVDRQSRRLRQKELDQKINELNTEVFSEEAAKDRFIDRGNEFTNLLDELTGANEVNSVDAFIAGKSFQRELAKAIEEGKYWTHTSTIEVVNPRNLFDDAGNAVARASIQVVEKFRYVDSSIAYQAQLKRIQRDMKNAKGAALQELKKQEASVKRQIEKMQLNMPIQKFGTEFYYKGRRLSGDEYAAVSGACNICGIVFVRGMPGVCVNPGCRKVNVIRKVAETKLSPAEFVQDIANAAGQGPLMSALKERMSMIGPVSRVVVYADPRVQYNRKEIVRLFELLDLPPGTRFHIPSRGGIERELKAWLRVQGQKQQADYERAVLSPDSPLYKRWGNVEIIPDYTVDDIFLQTRADLREIADRGLGGVVPIGTREASQPQVAMMRAILEQTKRPGDTLVVTLGNSADIRALRKVVAEVSDQKSYMHYLQIGTPDGSQILREIRPTEQAADFILRAMSDVRPMSEIFDASQLAQIELSKRAIMAQWPGRFELSLSKNWIKQFRFEVRMARYEKGLENIRAAMATASGKFLKKLQRSEKRQVKLIDDMYRQRYQIPERFGEGIRSGVTEISVPLGPVEQAAAQKTSLLRFADVLGERMAKEVDAYGNAMRYTDAEKAELAAWIAALRRRASEVKPKKIKPAEPKIPGFTQEGYERYLDRY